MNPIVNADPHGKIALQGYDPVAFHAASRPIKGSPAISAEFLRYRYLFSSESSRASFEKQPER